MPDKRQPSGQTDSIDTALSSGSDLIARRDANRKGPFRLAGGDGTAAMDTAVDDATAEWVDEANVSVPAVVTMERIRREHGRLYQRLMSFADDWNRLRVLHALVEQPNGVTYDTLTEYANVTKRTLRKYLDRLEELDAVERGGKPTVVSFTSEDVRLLAADVTAFA